MASEHEPCKAVEIAKVEIGNLKNEYSRLTESVEEFMVTVDSKIESHKEQVAGEIDKIKGDFKSLLSEHYRIRESVLEIKNTVERAMDKYEYKVEQLYQALNSIITSRKEAKNHLIYPIIVSIVVGIIAFVAGKIL